MDEFKNNNDESFLPKKCVNTSNKKKKSDLGDGDNEGKRALSYCME